MAAAKTEIAGVSLACYVFNASGVNDSTFEELEAIANSASPAIMMKSCTPEPRKGNDKPRYSMLPYGSIQCMGLPNLGCKEYIRFASKLKKYKKPIIASIAGFCPGDYKIMCEAFQKSDADLIEVNLSCPNIEGKSQIAYDTSLAEDILAEIWKIGKKPIGLKLPPYYDYANQEDMAELIKRFNVSFITCINSIGNALAINPETETTMLKPKKGFGGLCGDYIKPIALGNIRNFYELLDKEKNKVSIIGVGGIKSGSDAFEFLLAGADAVQVGTAFEREGPSCFKRINKELECILGKKGYKGVQEAKGGLKYL
ncbi:dihydroorotate oxidase [Candidatus Pacearchaeota archaeon]|nr:dihydroorotate oxidase [Candidatus Pacearchaeota archaeon]